MLKRVALFSAAVAGAFLVAAPTAATAYAGGTEVDVTPAVIDRCEQSTIAFSAGYFDDGQPVAVEVSGHDAETIDVPDDVTAATDGSLTLTFAPPEEGTGAYDVAFSTAEPAADDPSTSSAFAAETTPTEYTATIHVNAGEAACSHDPGVAAGGIELALTGGGVSPWLIGGGAAVVGAGVVLLAVGAVRRARA